MGVSINVIVTWGGHDPGGSGIATYDVQYRVNNGSWVNWQTATTETTAALPGGNSGETYSFRTRATDHAHNIAGWPTGNGDTSTTFYAWGVSGVAYDNAHTPVSNIMVNANPPLMGQLPANVEGIYGVYLEDETSSYAVSWEKAGYGSLPETVYPAGPDAQIDVILPPADNVVANWGFEEGFSNWHTSGSITPTITDSIKHSGSQAIFLGLSNPGFALASRLSDGSSYNVVVDSKGNLHVLWRGAGIYYAWRNSNGAWSAIETLSDHSTFNTPQLVIDANNTLHATWDDGTRTFYTRKPQNSTWSTPENITIPDTPHLFTAARISVDQRGVVHAFIPGSGPGYYWDYYYRQRLPNGTWSSPQLVSHTYGGGTNLKLLIDHSGTLHAVWEDSTDSGYNEIFYIQRSGGGVWSPLERLTNSPQGNHSIEPDLVIDNNNILHLVWEYFGPGDIYYSQKRENESWSIPELLYQQAHGPKLALAGDGRIHMTWYDNNAQIQYARRSLNGLWSPAFLISPNIENVASPQILTDVNNLAHVVWGGLYGEDVYYTHQLSDDTWETPFNLSNSNNTPHSPVLAIDTGGYVHVIWSEAEDEDDGVYYSGPILVNSDGEAIVSQNVSIPVTMTTPMLSFLYRSGGVYSAEDSHIAVMIDNGTVTELPIIATSQGNWTHYSASLFDWIGETVTLTLELEQEAFAPAAWVVIDEVTLGSTYSDNWVSVNDGSAAPGQEVVQTITYSNRGGAAASGVTVTYTLPAGMTYLSASIPPASANPLVWHLPDLPAKSEPFEILVTARVNANTPAFTTLTSTAVISTTDPELELLNNQAEGRIYTATFRYLPVILR